jgi:hypothetical protein
MDGSGGLIPARILPAFLCLEISRVGDAYSGGGEISGLHCIAALVVGLAFARPVIWKKLKELRRRRLRKDEASRGS